MGEVYAVDTLGGSILILIALLVYSPLLCLMSLIGAVIGTLFGKTKNITFYTISFYILI